MKRITMLAAFFMAAIITTMGQADYKMIQLTYLKPLPGTDMEAASKAMAKHNNEYHPTGKFHASVWSNITGSRVGTICWVMEAGTFTDLDNRPNDKAHNDDWRNNVATHFEVVANEFWKYSEKLSYSPEDYEMGDKVVWTVIDIRPGDGYRFSEMMKKIKKVYEEKKYNFDLAIYWNEFDNREGRDVAMEVSFGKWAFLDEDHSMKKDFEEVHGEGSWWKIVEEWRDIVLSSEDEVSALIPELSGK